MNNNTAAGPDGIPAEILKAGGPDLLRHIHALLLRVWEKEEIPAQLRDALIVSTYKKKGDQADCGTTAVFPFCPLLGKHSPGSWQTGSSPCRKTSSLNLRVASIQTEVPWT